MAQHELTQEFGESQRRINLGERVRVAQAAHLEVTAVLRRSAALRELGLNPTLIGSYARDTSVWPGKDVDVFGKLERQDIKSIAPGDAYGLFKAALAGFGERLQEQPRSLKITFGSDAGYPLPEFLKEASAAESTVRAPENRGFSFSVDVVPAVRWDDKYAWGIPTHDAEFWKRAAPQERWVKTNPEVFTELTQNLNRTVSVLGQGAYVPSVKAMRQIKAHHLGKGKPGALYFEFMAYEGFNEGEIQGESWADLTRSTLDYVVGRLHNAPTRPVSDPALHEPYQRAPSAGELAAAAEALAGPARQASEALATDRCRAAHLWRGVFGANGHEGHESVFPIPEGCRADGTVLAAVAANPLTGGSQERGFGRF